MNFKTLESTFEAAVKQAGLLGTLFWWDLGNNRIEHGALKDIAQQARLPDELLPPPVKAVNAFRRAWRAAARRVDTETLLRQVAETPDQIVVAVVREQPDVTNLDLRYQVLARASFDKKRERVVILERTPITESVETLFAHYSAVTTEDIRTMVLAFVRKSGLSIRHAGGVYFIPPALSDALRALTDVLKATGPNTVWALPVANLGDAGKTLASLARETLDAEIGVVERELAAFDARDIETRDSTLERRLKKFEELRGRTNLMAGALSFRADALLEKLTALEGDVKRRLIGSGAPEDSAVPHREPDAELEVFDAEAGF